MQHSLQQFHFIICVCQNNHLNCCRYNICCSSKVTSMYISFRILHETLYCTIGTLLAKCGCILLVLSAVQNIQSTMLRQISSVIEDEVSEMPEPDVVSQSPQQSQLKCGSSHMLCAYDFVVVIVSLVCFFILSVCCKTFIKRHRLQNLSIY